MFPSSSQSRDMCGHGPLYCALGLLLVACGWSQSTTGTHPVGNPEHTKEQASQSKRMELDGCLTTSDGLMPKLTLFHSQRFYRLQGRQGLERDKPLVFTSNANALVHVTGHLGPGPDIYDPDHAQVFVVDQIEKLAPTCNQGASLPELHRKLEKPQVPVEPRISRVGAAPLVEMTGEALLFDPPTIRVKVGQTVEWKNSSAEVHTVTADPHVAVNPQDVSLPEGAHPFDSGYLNPGQTYQHTFRVPGVYRYVCTLHEVQHMVGRVIVQR